MSRRQYKTRDFLLAENQALRASVEAEREESRKLRQQVMQFQQANLQHVRDISSVHNLRDLSIRQQALTQAGVPCFIQGGYIKHQFTRAVIP